MVLADNWEGPTHRPGGCRTIGAHGARRVFPGGYGIAPVAYDSTLGLDLFLRAPTIIGISARSRRTPVKHAD